MKTQRYKVPKISTTVTRVVQSVAIFYLVIRIPCYEVLSARSYSGKLTSVGTVYLLVNDSMSLKIKPTNTLDWSLASDNLRVDAFDSQYHLSTRTVEQVHSELITSRSNRNQAEDAANRKRLRVDGIEMSLVDIIIPLDGTFLVRFIDGAIDSFSNNKEKLHVHKGQFGYTTDFALISSDNKFVILALKNLLESKILILERKAGGFDAEEFEPPRPSISHLAIDREHNSLIICTGVAVYSINLATRSTKKIISEISVVAITAEFMNGVGACVDYKGRIWVFNTVGKITLMYDSGIYLNCVIAKDKNSIQVHDCFERRVEITENGLARVSTIGLLSIVEILETMVICSIVVLFFCFIFASFAIDSYQPVGEIFHCLGIVVFLLLPKENDVFFHSISYDFAGIILLLIIGQLFATFFALRGNYIKKTTSPDFLSRLLETTFVFFMILELLSAYLSRS